ncbi:MAG: DUF1987 domain-containing protein [Bacteroidales bacterium]|nr:DUF1987 domain-containing protein [Bacteroidales bacterium]MDT8373540.1 DUF1987 domain-containing protein [Bacteroidales bacterium]
MEKLIINPTVFTPRVNLDHEEHFLEIEGESRPQDVREFYYPILDWMTDFSETLLSSDDNKKPVIFHFNFNYFNSGSAKCILDICKILARLRSQNINASARWYYVKDDDDMLEAGREMAQIVNLPFEFIESENNEA